MTKEELLDQYQDELSKAFTREELLQAAVKFYKAFSILLTEAIGHKDRRIAELEQVILALQMVGENAVKRVEWLESLFTPEELQGHIMGKNFNEIQKAFTDKDGGDN